MYTYRIIDIEETKLVSNRGIIIIIIIIIIYMI